MKLNSKGFTLIELLVATAILGIVVIGALGFMVTGARSFQSVFANIGMQYTAQQAMNQMQDTVADCDTAIYVPPTGDKLYMVNEQSTGSYTVCPYSVSGSEIQFQRADGVTDDMDPAAVTGSKSHLLATDVAGFSVSLAQDATTGEAATVTCTIELERRSKAYAGTQIIALRNNPTVVDSLAALIDACE